MTFTGFTETDFNVFSIEGLDERMEALKLHIRPKLQCLGDHFAPTLSAWVGEEMFAHVAKHARRTINPPKDTWVAFANNHRGYKMLPHFQIGLWETHVFIWFAIIYEAPLKTQYGKLLEQNIDQLYESTPKDFVWSVDHMKPDVLPHESLSKEDLQNMFLRLQTVKKAEILCGTIINKQEAINMTGQQFIDKTTQTLQKVLVMYEMRRALAQGRQA